MGSSSSLLRLTIEFASHMTSTAALSVVIEATLWIHINSFVPGLPTWTIDYARRHEAETMIHVPSAIRRRAKQQGDDRTLHRLQYLQRQPEYKVTTKLRYHSAMHYAAISGNLDLVKWFHENTKELCQYDTMAVAARNGHAAVVRWLQHNRPESQLSMGIHVMDDAATRGFLEVVQLLHEERKEGCTTIAMDGAAGNGHLQAVEYLHTHTKGGCTRAAFDTAAANGHLDVVEWLHEHLCMSGTKAASFGAAVNGHVEVVRFLLDHRDSGVVDEGIRLAILSLIEKGDSMMLSFLLEECPQLFPLYSMAVAAEHGHLDLVKLLHPTRPREDIDEALVRGAKTHPLVVEYLLENDTFTEPVLKAAVIRAKTLEVGIALRLRITPEVSSVDVFGFVPSHKPHVRASGRARKSAGHTRSSRNKSAVDSSDEKTPKIVFQMSKMALGDTPNPTARKYMEWQRVQKKGRVM